MPIENQRERERFQLDRFRSLLASFPVGEIRHGVPPAPDFLIVSEARIYGVELTELYWDVGNDKGSPLEALARHRDRVLADAQRLWLERQGTCLEVDVLFRRDEPRDFSRAHEQASEMVDFIERHLRRQSEIHITPYSPEATELPKFLVTLYVMQPSSTPRGFWAKTDGGAVATLTDVDSLVRGIVAKKSERVRRYGSACDEVWLVVVATGSQPSATVVEPLEEPRLLVTGSFDRVFFYSMPFDFIVEAEIVRGWGE